MAGTDGQQAGQGRFTLRSPREALQPSAPPPMPPPPGRYRRRGGIISKLSGFLTFLLIAGILGYAALGAVRQELSTPGPLAEDRSVVIPKNTGFSEAAEILQREGVISSELWFRIASGMRGGKLQAGEFLFNKGISMRQVVDTLVAGKSIDRKITIPEGLTSQQIIARLKEVDFLVGEVTAVPPEGSLLPDTYQVERGTTRDAFLARLQREQTRQLERIWASRADGLPLKTPQDLVILASIVEKETAVADERSRVAAVYINRLNTLTGDFINAAGKKEPPMTLDSDPTVIYGLTKGSGVLGRGLLRSELRDESNPYNTYQKRGLPPGPIANPGRAAMEAVANPSRTKELYFVADGTGGHAFAESLAEHNRNVARWRRIEAEAAKAAAERNESAPAPDASGTGVTNETGDGATPPAEPGKQGAVEDGFLPDEMRNAAVFVEAASSNEGAFQLAEGLKPPKPAEFDGVPSYPVPPRMRKNKKVEPDKLEGTVEPGLSKRPEDSVPLAERNEAIAPLAPTDGTAAENPGIAGQKPPRITDASEGKKFDPLKLKRYDLNATQVIPKL